jgi:hypothetical protein
MDNTKVKRARKTKVQKVEEPIYEPVVEEKEEPVIEPISVKARKNNAWIEHVRAYRVDHPEISYTVAMKEAKQTYKK